MAEEEFQESEVMFEDHYVDNKENGHLNSSTNHREAEGKKLKSKKSTPASLPVNIPEGNHLFQYMDLDSFDEEYGEMEPPHVTVEKRIAGKRMAFSVCSGNESNLKGRDFILRMTGFIET